MNKYTVSIFLFVSLFLSFAAYANAVTINSVTVSNQDVFYSAVDGNNKVYLVVNVTGANSSDSAIVVTADFFDFGASCVGSGSSAVINLINAGGDLWTGTCDVGDEAGALAPNSFMSGKVIVKANETYGPSSSNSDLNIALYNIGIPGVLASSCFKFVDGSTNFNQVINFNNMDVKLVVQANDGNCVLQGYDWNTGWLTVGELTFNGVNFNNNVVDAKKLTQLSDIVKLRFASSKTFQNTRLIVDTAQLPELNVTPFTVKLYHLSLLDPQNDFVVSDNAIQAQSIEWVPNGFDDVMQYNTYNLTFIVINKGFKGFTITDNALPNIISYTPTINQIFNDTTVTFNTLVNGTGTEISKTLFIVNGVSNVANCSPILANSEIYNCSATLNQNDGTYNLSIATYDYGGDTGNLKQINLSYMVETQAPTLSVTSPTNDATYTATAGSMLKINFTTNDGNGIGSCGYTLTGPINLNDVSIENCSGDESVQLYLQDGDYNLFLYSKDTLNMMNSTNISFTVQDTAPPVITNNTRLSNRNNITLSVITDEKATCKYSTSNTTYDKMRYAFTDNAILHTANVTLPAQGVDYTYYIRCSDLSGNINKDSFQTDLYYGALTNVSSTIPLNAVKLDPSETLELKILSSGKNIMMFNKLTNPVELITLVTNDVSSDVIIKITTVSAPTVNYSEKVYKYFSVDHAALRDSKIDGANITFRVEKSWLTSNGINKSDMVLARFSDSWIPLNTLMTREDDTYVYYNAISPGLSLFAIYRQVKPEIIPPVVATNTVASNGVNDNATSDNLNLLNKRNYNWWIVILVAIVVFAIIMFIVMINRNDQKNPPIFAEDRTAIGRIKRLFK